MDTSEDVDLAAAAERKARKAATLWNVRGVDEAHRAMAKEAAEKCDMTLGRWLTEVIEKLAPMGNAGFLIVAVGDGGMAADESITHSVAEQPKISENPEVVRGGIFRDPMSTVPEPEQAPVKGRAPASTRS